MAYPTEIGGILGIWTALALMLMIYSYALYKENPFYRFAEHTFIGVGLTIMVLTAIQTTNRIAVQPLITQGEIVNLIPLLLGVAMFFILSDKQRWISRYPISILIGVAIGLGMRGVIIPQILSQIQNTITTPQTGMIMDWFNFFYIALGTICSIMYFLLSYDQSGNLKYPSKLGRGVIMLGLGGMFGNTVLGRMTMLAGRAQFLLQVLKIIPM